MASTNIHGNETGGEFEYVRKRYGVNPKRGGRVRVYNGRLGTIMCGAGNLIRIHLDGDKHSGYWHPTWRMEYLDV
jgi:hypothetical protein